MKMHRKKLNVLNKNIIFMSNNFDHVSQTKSDFNCNEVSEVVIT